AGLERRLARLYPDAAERERRRPEYAARLAFECRTIAQMGFPGYFLIVADFINWAKQNGVPVGPGRGSGAGSLVAYSLGITDLDPLRYELLFERFLNPERVSMPDFDVDFCQDRRGEVIEYVRGKYGRDQVSQIITFGRLQAKACIRDVGRVLGMPYGEVDQIAKLVPEKLGIALDEALDMEPRFAEMRAANPTVDALFRHALKLEGLTRSFGKHAGGVIITDKPLVNYAPLLADDEGAVVVQYDKDAAEKVGLVKFDFLGLKTLTHIQKAVDMVNLRWQREGKPGTFRIEDTGVDDPGAYALIAKGDTNGVFQVESSGMMDLCKKLGPANLEELTWINALYRPGPLESGMVDDFIQRKHGRVKIEYMLPQLEDVLKESLGVFIYQEQVMRAARVLAGYSLGEADLLRRAMGKKKPEEMQAQKERFTKGALARGVAAGKANEIFDLMEKFSGYGFNKSHATAYAYVSYQTAYLKAHYPAQFYAALLTTEMSDTDKLAKYIGDAKDHGVAVLGPDVNQSGRHFNVVAEGGVESIRFGLEAIKGLGESAVAAILEDRGKSGPFRTFPDFCRRMASKKVNKKTLESLIRSGAFDALYADRRQVNRPSLLASIEGVMQWAQKQAAASQVDEGGLFAGLFSASDGPVLQAPEPELQLQADLSHMQRLEAERELMGFYVSGHPLDPFKPVLRQCVTYPISTVHELNSAGKLPRKPDASDWKARKAAAAKEPTIGGIVTQQREITTKKGDRMAFATLEDFEGKIEVVCFPKTWEKFRDFVKVGAVVQIQGQLEGDGTTAKMLASKVEPLEAVAADKMKKIRMVVFRLDPEKTSRRQLEELMGLVRKCRGDCSGVIEYTLKDGVLARYRMPDDLKFAADYNFVQGVNEIFGRDILGFH
ncbi:MAG: DNA polymerase III subunit alpha, partial [Bdellovibrionales bacterium]|nr:DNA polymerase III subunit alpha [Bdellovibrionales bacterium]